MDKANIICMEFLFIKCSSVYILTCLSTGMFLYLSVCLSVCLSVYLFLYLSTGLSSTLVSVSGACLSV